VLFTKEDVEAGLSALVDELVAVGAMSTIQVVGGAAIMLHVNRETLTDDIDALHATTEDVRAAIARVADVYDWPSTWLNDAVKMWVSHYDTSDDWEIRFAGEGVTILVALPPILLAMKLQAGRGRRDATDIDLLLDACGIASLTDAMAVFDKYYPTETMAPKALQQLRERFEKDV
jgi:hypothetical protein